MHRRRCKIYISLFSTIFFLSLKSFGFVAFHSKKRKFFDQPLSLGRSLITQMNNDDLKGCNRRYKFDVKNCLGTDENTTKKPTLVKVHFMTVCMVPPSQYENVWEALTKARVQLKDPGFFRWPPHANLLYPFLNVKPIDKDFIDDEKLQQLSLAVKKIKPFRVSLDSFGTFGGTSRGVLYTYPRSYKNRNSLINDEGKDHTMEPLIALQSVLYEHFPECPDQQQKYGKFTPHITLSHFPSLEDAQKAQKMIESWWTKMEFDVHEIYLLRRLGDGGQFKKIATLPLGSSKDVCQHHPDIAFDGMPTKEVNWVYEERMQLKARRNGNIRRRKRDGGREQEGIID